MITGALIGKNVNNSFSKFIHERLSLINYDLLSCADEKDVLKAFKSDYSFLNITNPYKSLAFEKVDSLSHEAFITKTVNTIIKENDTLKGFNTDVYGFAYLLNKNKLDVKNKICTIMGNGASCRSVYYVLFTHGAKKINILSRSPKGENIYSYNDKNILNESDFVINTTPVGGMNDQNGKSLIDFSSCKHLETFIDLNYYPLKTTHILEAKKYGIKTINGLDMLIAQAIKSNEITLKRKYKQKIYKNMHKKTFLNFYNIVLIGHPASGKTTIGNNLAKLYNAKFVDIDKEIERNEKMPNFKIIEEKGEEYFRNIESKIIEEISLNNGQIISTGGGIILKEQNMINLMKNSLIINLERKINLINNQELKTRPLSKTKEDLIKLIEIRKDLYNKYADFNVKNDSTIQECIEQIGGYIL